MILKFGDVFVCWDELEKLIGLKGAEVYMNVWAVYE